MAMSTFPNLRKSTLLAGSLAVCIAAMLSACGGSSGSDQTSSDGSQATTATAASVPAASATPAAVIATATTTLSVETANLPDAAAAQIAKPFFHSAPGLLQEPDNTDAANSSASGLRAPTQYRLAADLASVPTAGLTVEDLQNPDKVRELNAQAMAAEFKPMAGTGVIATYTPAQIRAAYGLPLLPPAGAALSATQAAQLGAGQTIYIVDAYHDPNIVAELAAFNAKFGLPACTTKAISATASLPLAAASTTACELSVVYNTAAGGMTTTAPAYDAGWATEITLDVQWAHATAPLARIVLIEAPDASLNSLLGAVKLANAMGPGVVSMSFGATEGTWTSTVDSAFSGTNMTYLAATGDWGAQVSWPSVSTKVLAVGGTTLNSVGNGTRSEVGWTLTGGGISAYTATPSYQTPAVPGLGSVARRAVADVAFNADPKSGQYVAVINAGSSAVSWVSAGGTSLSTPQWAGLIAIANAVRATTGKQALGAPHAVLYGQIASTPGTYASVFSDITVSSNGTCSLCTAKAGYDALTGLGTPNVTSLLTTLTGSTANQAPIVTSASITGKVAIALSFTVSVSSANPVTYTLSGAPAGMTISTAGVVSWASPVVGTYPVTVTAKDSKTALSGQGVYTVSIAQVPAPVVNAAAISGSVGTPLSFTPSVTASNPVTLSLSGAPAGMMLSATGAVSWSSPVAGTYKVTVLAKDTKTGLSGQGVLTVAIAAPLPPSVSAATVNGKPGTALSFIASAMAPNPVTWSIAGAPSGMTISANGTVSWPSPLVGTYSVTVTAKDTRTGLSGQGLYTVKIAVAGPVITFSPVTGVAGKAVTGTIGISDATSPSVSISISGVPLGMSFSLSGTNIIMNWANPVAGSYSLKLYAVDSAGLSAQVTIPVTIAAK
jgi:subtilase family serine protease